MKPGLIVLLILSIMLPVTGICAYSVANRYSFKTNFKTNFGIFEFEGKPHDLEDLPLFDADETNFRKGRDPDKLPGSATWLTDKS